MYVTKDPEGHPPKLSTEAPVPVALASCYYIWVLILLYVCPRSICVLILLYICPHTTIYVSSYYYTCVLILPYLCPNNTKCVSSSYHIFVPILLYVSSYSYICVRILPYMCSHDTICVLILPYVSSYYHMCLHTTICVLILLYIYLESLFHALRRNSAQSARTSHPVFITS